MKNLQSKRRNMSNTALPANPESEQAAIAYALRNPTQWGRMNDICKAENFYHVPYRWAWEAMERLSDKGLAIDILTLTDELERAGQLDEFHIAGGTHYGRAGVSGIKQVNTSEGGESYAVTVQVYAAKRQILQWLNQGASWAMNGRPAHDILVDLETSFGSLVLHEGRAMSHTINMSDATEHAIEAAKSAAKGERALSTGLIDLDKILAPQKTELITIAARPGKGKSSLLATIAVNAARAGKRVKFFVLEMGHVPVTQRMLAQIGGLDAFRLMQGKLRDEEWTKLTHAVDELRSIPLILCDLPAIKIGQIRTEARRSNVDVIIIDYIQLAQADKKNERRDLDIGEITRGLSALAIELDIPIIAAAQMNRNVEGRAEKRPTLADLADSSSIEKDSSSVVFIHEIDGGGVELIIEKHRNGPIGTAAAYFDRVTTSFRDGVKNYHDFASD
jgi:replicative DNA helicase